VRVPDGVRPDSKTWPYVLAYAIEMERKLEENGHKNQENGDPGWLEQGPDGSYLFRPNEALARVQDEVNEIRPVLNDLEAPGYRQQYNVKEELIRETADVGNMAMMLACVGADLDPYIDTEAAIRDLGVALFQPLLDAGLNVFAIELLAESYVRSKIPDLGPIRFTVPTRKESGKSDKVLVRLTIELG